MKKKNDMGNIEKWTASKIVFQNVSAPEMSLRFLCCAKLSLNTLRKSEDNLQPPVKFWWDIYTLDFLI
jgi:hypothetical protein